MTDKSAKAMTSSTSFGTFYDFQNFTCLPLTNEFKVAGCSWPLWRSLCVTLSTTRYEFSLLSSSDLCGHSLFCLQSLHSVNLQAHIWKHSRWSALTSHNPHKIHSWAETTKTFVVFQVLYITYLPHEAVAEVSKDKEPIGREFAEFNWFKSQSMSDSNELRVKWFGCHLISDSNHFGCQLIWDSIDLVVSWFEIQMIWLSIGVWFKWFEVQVIWLSTDVWCKWFCQTKLFCEISLRNEALKIKNEAIPRDFLQNWSFQDEKRSFSARLPSKLKLWRSKTKHFCETSFKIDMLSRHLTSELQYVLTIFNCMLQKYCACHEKVAPRHTNSCNCHAKWSLQSNTSVTWNLQPFHGFSVGCFKHRHHKARNHCACHAKRVVPDPLEIHHACQRFCNPHELLRLPRILQRVEIPAPATQNTLWSSKNVPRPSVFNDFDFQIALARRRGAIFAKLNFQKPAETLKF